MALLCVGSHLILSSPHTNRQHLQANIAESDEFRQQQNQEIVELKAQNATLQKKCDLFKEKVKSLNEKNKSWEESYKAQSNDLVLHGMEISRLNDLNSELKSQFIREGPGLATPRGRELSYPDPM